MHLNKSPAEPPGMPCIRDYSELISDKGLLPELLVKLTPLPELERRCEEIAAEHPRFREEVPLVLAGEKHRRRRFRSLQIISHPLVPRQQHA